MNKCWGETPPLIFLAHAFLFNRLVLNENLWMNALVFICIFPYEFMLKIWTFLSELARNCTRLTTVLSDTCFVCPWHVTTHPAHVAPVFSVFFFTFSLSSRVLSSFRLILGHEIEFPQLVMSLEDSWIFIPCLPNSSWGVFLCLITWIFSKIREKHLKIVWFMEELELHEYVGTKYFEFWW